MEMFPIQYAYHVISKPANDDFPPNFTYLIKTVANDVRYDGPLVGLSGVFFTTTLRAKKLPTYSPYPVHGSEGQKYWRLKVPISHFKDYDRFWFCDKILEPQRRMILTKSGVDDEAIELFEMHPDINEIKSDNNPFLKRNHDQWFSNDFDIDGYFNNFVVLDNPFLIPVNREWDIVTRSNHGPGYPKYKHEISNDLWKENVRLKYGPKMYENVKSFEKSF